MATRMFPSLRPAPAHWPPGEVLPLPLATFLPLLFTSSSLRFRLDWSVVGSGSGASELGPDVEEALDDGDRRQDRDRADRKDEPGLTAAPDVRCRWACRRAARV